MPNALTTETFIQRSIDVFGNRYNYSKSIYTTAHSKVIIICQEHGEFEQTPNNHLWGESGCPKCKYEKHFNDIRDKSKIEFISQSINIHNNKYDYSIVDYINNNSKVKILCIPHNVMFEQTPKTHKNGTTSCPKCKHEFYTNIANKRNKKGKEEFSPKSQTVHNNKYDYSLVNYIDSYTKVIIVCPIHGKFSQRPNDHIQGKGCPKCKASKGEIEIEQILIDNNIEFINEKRFSNCKDKSQLPFDFYIPQHNTVIEYDGEQHSNPFRIKGKEKEMLIKLKKIQYHDTIKTQYCIDNNIKLIRIPYTEFNNIESILKKELL